MQQEEKQDPDHHLADEQVEWFFQPSCTLSQGSYPTSSVPSCSSLCALTAFYKLYASSILVGSEPLCSTTSGVACQVVRL